MDSCGADEFVSIHAPARGATPSPRQTSRSLQGFNPRPARGRPDSPGNKDIAVGFNPRPARGATQTRSPPVFPDSFNPRPSREGRRNQYHISCRLSCFNPRPCARGDLLIQFGRGVFSVSIHAPARGATHAILISIVHYKFQSTPLREGRPGIYIENWQKHRFQSTPLREGRLLIQFGRGVFSVSIHALREGRLMQFSYQ